MVNALKNTLPGESFIYVGDTARVPYGEKDVDTLRSYGEEIINFLVKQDVKAIIVACGTLSSNVIEDMKNNFNVPIIDVIGPGIEAALSQVKNRLGIVATAATIKSGFFQKAIKEKSPNLDVEAKACPLFVQLIEEGWSNNKATIHVVKAYLEDWLKNPIDTLVLGCTHYPLLSDAIHQVLGDITLIDMAVATAETTQKFLLDNGLMNNSGGAFREFYVSGDVEKFNNMGSQITGLPIKAKKVYWES